MKKGVHSCPVHKHLKKNQYMYLVNVVAQNLMSHPGNTQLLISPISVLR